MTVPAGVLSGADLADAILALHGESVAYWATLATGRFLEPIGDAWSPAENVRHLSKSMRAVSQGLRLPRWLLWLAFRGGRGVSRGYEEMRQVYLDRLARGASAGRFAPSRAPVPADPEAERARIMGAHAAAVHDLAALVRRWPDAALDRRRLPHPLLGPLTVREMLAFTLYHNRHHMEVVRRRLAAAG